jgi:acyl-coenzyme A thioesterase PaaI-like protein
VAETTPRTHLGIDRRLCGEPRRLAAGRAEVELATGPEMAADDHGLVHGGFVFGLADYAAMLAVNHPNVVLGAAETRFLAPAVVGERLTAEAVVKAEEGRRREVAVTVRRGADELFTGTFTCFVLGEHVLAGRRRNDR